MRATVFHGPRDMRVDHVPDAALSASTDALVRVTHACVCGSDLWPYRGELLIYGPPGGRTGHEFIGIVEAFMKKRVAGNNPWGEGADTLEWQLSSPPPYHQWEQLPRIK